jgi:aminoglycoside N3'-acetyltransferase
MESIRPEQIVDTIRAMGVRARDLLIAHSSYKRFGAPIAGGPTAVAQALVEAVSPGGSVFVATFNYGQAPYDPATTRSFDGAVSETFRQLPGVIRSPHPTHPLAGVGPDAADILREHDLHAGVFAPGSPFWKLWERNAWVLLIGCGHESNSTIHVAEEIVQVPYLSRTRIGRVIREGQMVDATVRRPGCSNGFIKIDPVLRAAGKVIDGTVGASRLMLMRASDVVATAVKLLRGDATALLCERGCDVCDEARDDSGRAG